MSTSIEHDFWEFHRENPAVYRLLVRLARELVAKGHSKLGIGMLFEVIRWQHMLTTRDPASEFKLNNNYRSLYARLIMLREEDLAGVFEVRTLHRDSTLNFRPEDVAGSSAPAAGPELAPESTPSLALIEEDGDLHHDVGSEPAQGELDGWPAWRPRPQRGGTPFDV